MSFSLPVYAPPRWLVVRKTCPCSPGPAAERREISSYCRLFILLRRDGELSGINRIHRIYRKEGLAVASDAPARKAVDVRVPIREAERALFARLRL
jgi:hypothetical protein